MNIASPSRRLGLTVLIGLALALGSAACGPALDAGTAGSADADGTVSFGVQPTEPTESTGPAGDTPQPPPAGPQPGPTDLSPNYPDNAEAYSKAVVSAWTHDQLATLGSLAAAAVKDEILDVLPTVNDEWTYLRCDGTAGSSYCSFTNANGDLLTLRISHSLLAKAHAAIEVSLDKTEYPADGVAYVKEFVGAWQFGNTARMLKLSSPAVVATVKSPPVNPSYPAPTCCGGGLLQVKVQWSGRTARFDVGTIKLGHPNAIVDYDPGQLSITS